MKISYYIGFFSGATIIILLYCRMSRASLRTDVASLHKLLQAADEKLEYVSAHWKVPKHVRPKYCCERCQRITQAAAPCPPSERSFAGPGLLTHIAVSKYCDH